VVYEKGHWKGLKSIRDGKLRGCDFQLVNGH
jgi:hypothetical protein